MPNSAFSAPQPPDLGSRSDSPPEAVRLELFGANGKRITCRACCGNCGEHFSGTSAFDRHRYGSHQDGTRYCEYPPDVKDKDGLPQLVAKTEDGHCDLSGRRVSGVTVWQLRASAERTWEEAA